MAQGQSYSTVRGFFKQYDLIYIVADERDAVRVRTNYRHEQLYLYRSSIKPDRARRIFLDYLKTVDALVRGQDIGNKHGQDIGNRWHTKIAWLALRRRIVGWPEGDTWRIACAWLFLGSMRTFRIFGLEKGQLMAVIHFLLPSSVSDKH